MNRRAALNTFGLLVSIALLVSPRAMATSAPLRSETRLIVKFRSPSVVRSGEDGRPRSEFPAVERLLRQLDVRSVSPLFARGRPGEAGHDAPGLDRIQIVRLGGPVDLDAALESLRALPHVEFAEPDYLARGASETRSQLVPNDPLFESHQWAFRNTGSQTYAPSSLPREQGADINATAAWGKTTGDERVLVAVLDSGVNLDHPEWRDRLWTNPGEIPANGIDDDENGFIDDVHGYNFISANGDPRDDNGHGSAVWSVIGAASNNGALIAGLDWSCRLLAVKVLASDGLGFFTQIAAGVVYAADQGADVINLSVGGDGLSLALAEACRYAHDRGTLVVASMMNGNTNTPQYPAAFDAWVTAVGGTDPADDRCRPEVCGYGSNFGAHIDVVAPGVSIPVILYAGVDAWGLGAGTSFAAPMVSGVAALLAAQDSTLTPDQLRDVIRYSAVDGVGRPEEDGPGFDIYHGYGRLDAARALALASSARFPIMTAPDTVRAAEGTTIAFDVLVSDPDGDPIESLEIDRDDKPFAATFTVSEDWARGRFEWHPGYRDHGTYDVVFVAKNPFQVSATTRIEVFDVVDPPVVVAPFAATGTEGAPVAIVVTATDPDGDPLTNLTVAPLPPGSRFSAEPGWGSGRFEWTPTFMQAGSYPLDFTVMSLDPNGPLGVPLVESGTARTFLKIFDGPNQLPIVTGPATIEGAEGSPLAATFLVSEPDGDEILDVSATQLPLGATFTVGDAREEAVLAWTPGFDQAGTYAVTISATSAYRPTPVSEPEMVTGHALVSILIANTNRPPVSLPGGPYAGVVGAPIAFDGGSSNDPDGSPLSSYEWDFGDQGTAIGPAPLHSYEEAGDYTASLTVSDGELASTAMTAVSVAGYLEAAAFPDPADRVLRLMSAKPAACLRVEPVGRGYENGIIDAASFTLRLEGGAISIDAIDAKPRVAGDRDRNGVDELSVCFAKVDLRRLFTQGRAGRNVASMILDGATASGAPIRAGFSWDVIAAGGALAAALAPSPMRGDGVLTVRSERGGPLIVRLYDVTGRLVRKLLDDPTGLPGYHDVPVGVRDAVGSPLRSGVYFYRVDAPGESLTGKLTIIR
jgi:subtilisin family serine protease